MGACVRVRSGVACVGVNRCVVLDAWCVCVSAIQPRTSLQSGCATCSPKMAAWVPRQPLAVVAPVTEAQDTMEPHKMKSRFTAITSALSPCRGQRGEDRPSGKRPGMGWPGRRGRAHLPGCPRKRSLGSVRVVRVVRARAVICKGSAVSKPNFASTYY